MTRRTLEQMKTRRLSAMSAAERAEFESAYSSAKLAMEVGETCLKLNSYHGRIRLWL